MQDSYLGTIAAETQTHIHISEVLIVDIDTGGESKSGSAAEADDYI